MLRTGPLVHCAGQRNEPVSWTSAAVALKNPTSLTLCRFLMLKFHRNIAFNLIYFFPNKSSLRLFTNVISLQTISKAHRAKSVFF